jgi:thiamine-monophosphate kinase
VVDVDALPTSLEHVDGAARLGLDARGLALAGGEDYALLFTAAPGATPSHGVRIGEAVARRGIALHDRQGTPVAAPSSRGFDHFRP